MTDRELAGCALLPCPFCGEAPDLEREVIHFPGRHPKRFAVRCLTEGCPASNIAQDGEMGGFNYSWTEAEAIAAWNRRAPSSEGDGRDGERLLYLVKDGGVEGFCHVKADIYDYACDAAEESGRDEPNDADMLSGLRRLVDAAIAAAEGKRAKE